MQDSLTIAFAGDVMLGRGVNATIARHGFAYPWGNVLPLLRKADLFLVNLECALTSRTRPWPLPSDKPFHFRADPCAATTLRVARVGFAGLANNHSLDFGPEGLLETIALLDRAGIAHAGAGADLAAARAAARLLVGGWRINIVAFADYPAAWAATPTDPGINYTPISLAPAEFGNIESALAGARKDGDLVIFSIHWGPNMRPRPTPAFRAFARRVVDAGADIFWGHSAHVVQEIEQWHGRPILYDAGDFVDDYAVDEELRNDLSALFLARARPPHVDAVDLVPVCISQNQVNLAQAPDKDWVLDRVLHR